METTKLKVVASLTLVAVALLVPAAPASATATGSITFECTARFPAWPTGDGAGTCGPGTGPSAAVVALAGVDALGGEYTVYGTTPFNAAFNYNEGCLGPVPVTGAANGHAFIGNLAATRGTRHLLATVEADFTWVRLGTTGAITVTNVVIEFSDGAWATGSVGTGYAEMAPLLSADNTCPFGGSLTAVIAGEVTLDL